MADFLANFECDKYQVEFTNHIEKIHEFPIFLDISSGKSDLEIQIGRVRDHIKVF